MVKWVQGNPLDMAIRLYILAVGGNEQTREAYYPPVGSTVQARLVGSYRTYEYEVTMSENVALFSDDGSLPVGVYGVELKVIEADRTLRSYRGKELQVVNSTDEIDVGEFVEGSTLTFNDAIYVTGKDGVGIANTVLNDDYTLTITYTNGTSYTTPSIRGERGAAFTYEDFTEEQIAELQRPATEAAAEVRQQEAAIAGAEQLRVQAETARVNAENLRVEAEAARVTAEQARANAETARADAETLRVQAEAARANAETARVNAEAARVQAEAARVTAEQARANAETARVNAENLRVDAETARANAEQARADAEAARVQAEAARVTAEQVRVNSEAARANAEQLRVEAESARANAEQARADAEAARVQAEAARVTAEQARVNAEATRQQQEAARQRDTATAIAAAIVATTDAEKVNATLLGNILTVTDRNGNATTLDLSQKLDSITQEQFNEIFD